MHFPSDVFTCKSVTFLAKKKSEFENVSNYLEILKSGSIATSPFNV